MLGGIRVARGLLVGAALLGLGACAPTEFAMESTKSVAGRPDAGGAQASSAIGRGGTYKIGRPYQINGVWYYPKEDFGYSETGIASWYGPQFHGRLTANGEIYDMDSMTAAHPTLQLPSAVRVTNLENGRTTILRVNDRGPYHNGRVIDVSRRAAADLGFLNQGTAKVRVDILPDDSRRLAELAVGGASPAVQEAALRSGRGTVETAVIQTASLEPVAPVAPVQPIPAPMPVSTGADEPSIYVQTASFSVPANAERMRDNLDRQFGGARIVEAEHAGRIFYRVRLGPVGDVDAADRLLTNVIESGYPQSRLVVDR